MLISTDKVNFWFQRQWCQQIDGVTIGSKLESIFTDIFLANLERKLFSRLRNSNYSRHHDDISTVCEDEANAKNLFADLTVLYGDIGFTRSVHGKSPWIDQYLNFKFCVHKVETGVVRKHLENDLCKSPIRGTPIHCGRVYLER